MPEINSDAIDASLESLGEGLKAMIQTRGLDNPLMVGIHTGGVWVAERLYQQLALSEPMGEMDISFYRDDFSRKAANPQVKPSKLPVSLDDRHIILVDDVIHTGRTIRAALNELFDYGRPASVTLAALVERAGHELPIRADAVGMKLNLGRDEHIKLTGPDPLTLEIQRGRNDNTAP